MRIRKSLLGVGAAGIAAALAVPSLSAGAATKKVPVFVDLGTFASGEPDHIDPAITSTLNGAQVSVLLYDGLTETDESGNLVPAVASSWSSPDGGKTWVFKIKPGVRFSNREAVLPSSFKRGWERVSNPTLASEVSYHLDPIVGKADMDAKKATTLAGVVANDRAMTLTVTLNFAWSAWPAVVSHPVFSPVPKSMATADNKVEEQGKKLIGNGPYMLKEQISKQAGGHVKLVRNPYYKPVATLPELDFFITKDINAAYNSFESGQGMTAAIPPGQFSAAKAKYGDKGLGVVLGTDYWGFNWEDPVVGGAKNVLLRKAIVQAIDRQQLSTVIYEGTRPPTDGLLPKGIPGFRAGQGLGVNRNLDAAKRDFAAWQAAGNKLSEPLRLSYNDGAGWDKVANIFVANLKEAGIDAKLDPFPADGTYFTKMRKGGGQIIRAGWFADYVTADNFLYPLLHTKSIDGDNLERYTNPKFDALVDQARGQTSPAAANDLYAQAEKVVLSEDVVVIPTVNRASNYIFSSKVDPASIRVTPLGFVKYDKLKLKA